MAEVLSKEEAVNLVLSFAANQLKILGVRNHVFIAEVGEDMIAEGSTSPRFDYNILKLIFSKNNITPHVFAGNDVDTLIRDIIEELNN